MVVKLKVKLTQLEDLLVMFIVFQELILSKLTKYTHSLTSAAAVRLPHVFGNHHKDQPLELKEVLPGVATVK